MAKDRDRNPLQISDRVYDELNEMLNTRFQVVVNKDRSPRELFRNNVAQLRDFHDFSEESALEIIENTNDPYFVLNNFVGGDISSY